MFLYFLSAAFAENEPAAGPNMKIIAEFRIRHFPNPYFGR